jgi:hypothetical protein
MAGVQAVVVEPAPVLTAFRQLAEPGEAARPAKAGRERPAARRSFSFASLLRRGQSFSPGTVGGPPGLGLSRAISSQGLLGPRRLEGQIDRYKWSRTHP